MEIQFDVIVIGGGASGMMAAYAAGAEGKRVLILEKNTSLGEKLKITGGGRCNVTNAEPDVHRLLKYYGSAEPFLYSPFSQFGVQETFAFFESRGLPLVVEERNRVFPKTQNAVDVYRVLEQCLRDVSCTVRTNSAVRAVQIHDGAIRGVELEGGEVMQASSYILATGGLSRPDTGSTGDGFAWLAQMGHTVKPPTPTIVPLAVADAWVKTLAGVSIPEVKLTVFLEHVKQFTKKGPLLFTHFGISGPTVLNSSGKVSELLQSGYVYVYVDLFPQEDLGTLERRIIGVFDENKNKVLKNVLPLLLPAGTTSGVLACVPHINPDTKVHSVTKEERKQLVRALKGLSMRVTNLMGYDRAVVADGGVALSDIDMRTMRSKKIANLFVTGDLLHINRPSGGFSLQLCWTTGYVAGKHA